VIVVVVVVVVVLTSPSDSPSMGWQMPRRDEEFYVVLIIVDESGFLVSPLWCLTAILLIRVHHFSVAVVGHS